MVFLKVFDFKKFAVLQVSASREITSRSIMLYKSEDLLPYHQLYFNPKIPVIVCVCVRGGGGGGGGFQVNHLPLKNRTRNSVKEMSCDM